MEYCDFLEHFEIVERTQLFDSTWVQSAHWLDVKTRPLGSAWQFGDVSCKSFQFLFCERHKLKNMQVTFSIPKHTETILVLSQLDTRFFGSIASAAQWSFDFKLFKVGLKEAVGTSTLSMPLTRSAMLRGELPPGDYVVQVGLAHFKRQLLLIYIRTCRSGWTGKLMLVRYDCHILIRYAFRLNTHLDTKDL